MSPEAKFMVWGSCVAVGLIALDRIGLWMESRGWLYWRKTKRESAGGGAVGAGMRFLQELVEPQVQHVERDREQRRAIRLDERGGPPGESPPSIRRKEPAQAVDQYKTKEEDVP